MDYGDEGELNLRGDLRDEVERVLMDRGREAVAACEDRDADLADCADLLDGATLPEYGQTMRGGSTLVHPMTRIKHTELLANLAQPLKRDPLVQVTARVDADKEDAKLQESGLNDSFVEEGLKPEFYGVLHNLLRDKSAVLFAGWQDKTKTVHSVEYWDGESYNEDGTEQLTPEELRDPEIEYEEVDVENEEVEKSGALYRCVDLVNFYLIPSTARSLKDANGTLERVIYTESELLAGIETYKFDKEAVYDLIKAGGTLGTNDARDRANDTQGVTQNEGSGANEGEYECFMYFGNLPYLWDENAPNGAKLPKRLWNKQVCALWCPDHNIVFKLAESPYPAFPYFMRSLLPTPNRNNGSGMVEILEPLAHESTHYFRAMSNATDIEMQPVFSMGEETWEANKGQEFYAGARFVEVEGEPPIHAVSLPQNALMATQIIGYLDELGSRVASVQGNGELQDKVRKNGEVANMQQAADTKFDLYQWNAYSMLPDIAAWRVAMELHFGGSGLTGRVNGKETMISPDVLKKTFNYSVPQTSTDSSPEARQAKNSQVMALQTQYLQAKQAAAQGLMAPEDLELVYNAIADTLTGLDVRDVERVIGKKPEVPQMGANPLVAGMAGNPMGQMVTGGAQPPPMQGAPA